MKRPLFLFFAGLVLGEAAAVCRNSKGGYFPALFFLLTIFMGKLQKKNQCLFSLNIQKLKNYFLILFLSSAAGVCIYRRSVIEDEIWKDTLPAQETSVYGKINFLKINLQGNYDIILEKAIIQDGQNRKIRKKCRVLQIKKEKAELLPGDWIICRGTMKALEEPTNPGEFNARIYWESRGVSCQLFADNCRRIKREPLSVLRMAYKSKAKLSEVYKMLAGKEEAALFTAMILGDKSELSQKQKSLYEENGLAHLLAVSGLHVSVIGGSWFKFLRRRNVRYSFACLGGVLLLFYYGCITGFGSSVIRAAAMYTVYLGAEYFGTEYDMASSMALAGIFMLLESPQRLLEGGCQLSFGAVTAIGFVLPFVKEQIKKRAEKNRKDKNEGIIRRCSGMKKRLSEGFLAGIVITAVTFPLVLRVFYQYSPYSILLNLIVIPCMAPLMLSGSLAGITGMFSLPAGRLCAVPAVFIFNSFSALFEKMRLLPGAVLVTGCPSVLMASALYCFEGLLFCFWYFRRWRQMVYTALLLILFISFRPETPLRITLLDVGQGESVLMQMPGGGTVLMDGGSISRSKTGEYIIKPALKYYGIGSLDYVIVTHGDEDHISGIRELFAGDYPVKYLLFPKGQEQDENLRVLSRMAEERGTKVVFIQKGDRIVFQEAALTCLHPSSGFMTENKNEASLVFHLRYRRFDALFTGDVEKTGEKELYREIDRKIQNRSPLFHGKLELLKTAHHGSRNSTSEGFLQLTEPKAALISAGEHNRYGHPHKELMERLNSRKIFVMNTGENGAVITETNGRTWRISGYKAEKRRE